MRKTIIELPSTLQERIVQILTENSVSLQAVEKLHTQYRHREKGTEDFFISNFEEALVYLALRVPATYAQIYAASSFVHEVLTSWQPTSLLDIGSGPGTGLWAAQTVWPSITHAVAIDVNADLLTLGNRIYKDLDQSVQTSWVHTDIRAGIAEGKTYDLVVIANVLNELESEERKNIIKKAWKLCDGVLLIIEPGTEYGNSVIQSAAELFADSGELLAPYIDHSFVVNNSYWLHFPQRFTRPEFQRRLRQLLRDKSAMASDWEEAKFSYVAISKPPAEISAWGRAVGPVKKQKGFLEIPVLTKETIQKVKVMKRHKKQYTYAKELAWGEMILHKDELIYNDTM